MPSKIEISNLPSHKNEAQISLSKKVFLGDSWSGNERNCLFLNDGKKKFKTASFVTGFDFNDDGRAVALSDWDHDGDLDVWLCNRYGPQVRYLENQTKNSRWISLILRGDGKEVNRDAIGSTVTVWVEEEGKSVPLKRFVEAGNSFLSQSTLRVNVGLGKAKIERIEVKWPNGKVANLPALEGNKHYIYSYGEATARIWERPIQVSYPKVGLKEPNLANPRIIPVFPTPLPPLDLRGKAGDVMVLEDFHKGEIRWVKFWAGWCENCQNELKAMPDLLKQLEGAGITPLLVNADFKTNKNRMKSPVEGVTNVTTNEASMRLIQIYLDKLQLLQQSIALPFSVLLDEKGYVVAIYYGAVSVDTIVADSKASKLSLRKRYEYAIPASGEAYDKSVRPVINALATSFHAAEHYSYAKKLYAIGESFYQHDMSYQASQVSCEVDLKNFKLALPKLIAILPKLKDIETRYTILKNIGKCHHSLLDLKKAKKAYLSASELKETSEVISFLGLIFHSEGNLKEAQIYLRKAIDLNKKENAINHKLWRVLFKIYEQAGEGAKMSALLDEGLKLGVQFFEQKKVPAFEF